MAFTVCLLINDLKYPAHTNEVVLQFEPQSAEREGIDQQLTKVGPYNARVTWRHAAINDCFRDVEENVNHQATSDRRLQADQHYVHPDERSISAERLFTVALKFVPLPVVRAQALYCADIAHTFFDGSGGIGSCLAASKRSAARRARH